jgi:hypothetical protein
MDREQPEQDGRAGEGGYEGPAFAVDRHEGVPDRIGKAHAAPLPFLESG